MNQQIYVISSAIILTKFEITVWIHVDLCFYFIFLFYFKFFFIINHFIEFVSIKNEFLLKDIFLKNDDAFMLLYLHTLPTYAQTKYV